MSKSCFQTKSSFNSFDSLKCQTQPTNEKEKRSTQTCSSNSSVLTTDLEEAQVMTILNTLMKSCVLSQNSEVEDEKSKYYSYRVQKDEFLKISSNWLILHNKDQQFSSSYVLQDQHNEKFSSNYCRRMVFLSHLLRLRSSEVNPGFDQDNKHKKELRFDPEGSREEKREAINSQKWTGLKFSTIGLAMRLYSKLPLKQVDKQFACVYLAIKQEEMYPPSIYKMVCRLCKDTVSHKNYGIFTDTCNTITSNEIDVLQLADFSLHRPTVHYLIDLIIGLLQLPHEIYINSQLLFLLFFTNRTIFQRKEQLESALSLVVIAAEQTPDCEDISTALKLTFKDQLSEFQKKPVEELKTELKFLYDHAIKFYEHNKTDAERWWPASVAELIQALKKMPMFTSDD
jgi:hypothetical protein